MIAIGKQFKLPIVGGTHEVRKIYCNGKYIVPSRTPWANPDLCPNHLNTDIDLSFHCTYLNNARPYFTGLGASTGLFKVDRYTPYEETLAFRGAGYVDSGNWFIPFTNFSLNRTTSNDVFDYTINQQGQPNSVFFVKNTNTLTDRIQWTDKGYYSTGKSLEVDFGGVETTWLQTLIVNMWIVYRSNVTDPSLTYPTFDIGMCDFPNLIVKDGSTSKQYIPMNTYELDSGSYAGDYSRWYLSKCSFDWVSIAKNKYKEVPYLFPSSKFKDWAFHIKNDSSSATSTHMTITQIGLEIHRGPFDTDVLT